MTVADRIKKVRQIEIKTRQLVSSVFSGRYHARFKGRGLHFSEIRPYLPGDDVRLIHWGKFAKTQQLYVNVFEEERELSVLLAVDLSKSGGFGSADQLKRELAAEVAAILGFSAHLNQDRVGLVLFTDQIEKLVPIKKSKRHVMSILQDIFYFEPQHTRTNISTAIRAILNGQHQKSVVFLISDFLDRDYETAFRVLTSRHEVVPIVIQDPIELAMPDGGVLNLQDPETGDVVMVNTSDPRVRERYGNQMRERREIRNRFFASLKIRPIELTTGESVVLPLKRYFEAIQ